MNNEPISQRPYAQGQSGARQHKVIRRQLILQTSQLIETSLSGFVGWKRVNSTRVCETRQETRDPIF